MKTKNKNTSPVGANTRETTGSNLGKKTNSIIEVRASEKEKIPSVNFHLWEPCNMRCRFCFATFQDVKQSILPKGHLPEERAMDVIRELAAMGLQKITFAGGEPTLCPWLPKLIKLAKNLGMTTMIVTNGTGLTDEFLKKVRKYLDWIAISIDSLDPDVNISLGRAIAGKRPLQKDDYVNLANKIKSFGYGLKINTVITELNKDEDMAEFILSANPSRWKILQALPIAGQNDGKIDNLRIPASDFEKFLKRNAAAASIIVPEYNDEMKGSYVMVDPAGRFFDNAEGKHRYSDPILEVGGEKALSQVHYDFEKFVKRGGQYDWERGPKSKSRITLSGEVASGKSTVGKLLAERLGWDFTSIGNQTRKEAERLGLTIAEYQKECLTNPEKDKETDKRFADMCNASEGLVIDYRMGFRFVYDAFHIFLSISEELAIERIEGAQRRNDSASTLKERNDTFRQQFEQAYGIDYTDPLHYDLVIQCAANKSANQIVEEIIQALAK